MVGSCVVVVVFACSMGEWVGIVARRKASRQGFYTLGCCKLDIRQYRHVECNDDIMTEDQGTELFNDWGRKLESSFTVMMPDEQV